MTLNVNWNLIFLQGHVIWRLNYCLVIQNGMCMACGSFAAEFGSCCMIILEGVGVFLEHYCYAFVLGICCSYEMDTCMFVYGWLNVWMYLKVDVNVGMWLCMELEFGWMYVCSMFSLMECGLFECMKLEFELCMKYVWNLVYDENVWEIWIWHKHLGCWMVKMV